MRKIQFNEETIAKIKDYSTNHTLMESCNRFTLTPDVMKRVARENNIIFIRKSADTKQHIPDDMKTEIKSLFENTNISISEIRKQLHIKHDRLVEFLKSEYGEESYNKRSSKLYRLSKTGDLNPIRDNEYVSDGNGYIMVLKPDWYTGRKKSKYVFYHSVVMSQHLGITEIPKGYVIHHIDYNKENNSIDNLCLLTVSAHSKLHSIERKLMQGAEIRENRSESEMSDTD